MKKMALIAMMLATQLYGQLTVNTEELGNILPTARVVVDVNFVQPPIKVGVTAVNGIEPPDGQGPVDVTANDIQSELALDEQASSTLPGDDLPPGTLTASGTVKEITQKFFNFNKWVRAEFPKYLPLTGGSVTGQVTFVDKIWLTGLSGGQLYIGTMLSRIGIVNEMDDTILFPTVKHGAQNGDHFVTSSMLPTATTPGLIRAVYDAGSNTLYFSIDGSDIVLQQE